jgi:hypothetical protein
LKNKNYSEPIWVKNDNIAQIDNDKLKIWNNSLEDNINIEEFVGNINFLNSIKLSINKKTMQGVYDFIEKKIDTNQLYINKNKLIDNVYKINEIR